MYAQWVHIKSSWWEVESDDDRGNKIEREKINKLHTHTHARETNEMVNKASVYISFLNIDNLLSFIRYGFKFSSSFHLFFFIGIFFFGGLYVNWDTFYHIGRLLSFCVQPEMLFVFVFHFHFFSVSPFIGHSVSAAWICHSIALMFTYKMDIHNS